MPKPTKRHNALWTTANRSTLYCQYTASRRGRGGRIPQATPRNTYTKSAIQRAVKPPSMNDQTPNVDHICRHLDTLQSPSAAPGVPPFDPPADTPTVELAPPPDDSHNVDDASSLDGKEPLQVTSHAAA